MVKHTDSEPLRRAGLVASYVRAHPTESQLREGLDAFRDYLRFEGFEIPPGEIDRAVLDHWRGLERAAERARRAAELFTPGRPARPVRYRRGSAFCPQCAMYKEYRKECRQCGHLEFTR